eukprot:m.161224 g.161224  ORF g.161224 m.161224 type:complete len:238 (+) comp23830_c0_seq2:150-863(+)
MPTQGRDSRIQGHPRDSDHRAQKSPGCITIPALHFRCMNVAITTSHITWYIAEGAVFSPPRGMTKSSAMFSVGAQGSVNKPDPGDSGTFQNISIVGGWPGRFTVNISEPLTGGLAGQRQKFQHSCSVGTFLGSPCPTSTYFCQEGSTTELRTLSSSTLFRQRLMNGNRGRVLACSARPTAALSTSRHMVDNGGMASRNFSLVTIFTLRTSSHGEGGVTLRMETGIGGGYVQRGGHHR